jgi:hypothetical protein
MKYAAININFDSIAEMYGFPKDYRDPSFLEVANRFFAISTKYGFKYSIYIVGKDLENEEKREAVKRWHADGHEIGNHSWSHRSDLGALAREEIEEEVGRAHDLISKTIGEEIRGFIAPGWSTSRDLLEVLIGMGYEYDTSSFPSWMMYAALSKVSINFIRDPRLRRVWRRRDLAYCLMGPREPYVTSGSLFGTDAGKRGRTITVLPMPTSRARIACWHTLGFMFGWRLQKMLLRQCVRTNRAFYYLVHPADLLGREDLDPSRIARFERMGTSLDEKLRRFEECIKIVVESESKIVTMRELAKYAVLGRS